MEEMLVKLSSLITIPGPMLAKTVELEDVLKWLYADLCVCCCCYVAFAAVVIGVNL